jgi:sensor c-di-GMP phosphodiesterase-like protein
MLQGWALRLLIAVVLIDSVVCIVASAVIILESGGSDAQVGTLVYVSAVAALALTPLQVAAVAVVIAPRLREQRAQRRTEHEIAGVLATRRLRTVFQPVVDLDSRSVVGAEALTRSRHDSASLRTWSSPRGQRR